MSLVHKQLSESGVQGSISTVIYRALPFLLIPALPDRLREVISGEPLPTRHLSPELAEFLS